MSCSEGLHRDGQGGRGEGGTWQTGSRERERERETLSESGAAIKGSVEAVVALTSAD